MGYVEDNLIPGEQVLAMGTFNWLFRIRDLIVLILAVVLVVYCYGVLPDQWGPWVAAWQITALQTVDGVKWAQYASLVILALASVRWLAGVIHRRSLQMAVTTRRVIVKTGLLARNVVEINLAQVESIQARQSVLGRIFGYGRLTIHGTGIGDVVLPPELNDPFKFRQAVAEARENLGVPRPPMGSTL